MLTAVALASTTAVRTYESARSDLFASAEGLGAVLANALADPIRMDAVWPAYLSIQGLASAEAGMSDPLAVVVADAQGRVFVSSRPDASPSETRAQAPVLGVSSAMRDLEATLHRIAVYTPHTLISGESGAGKEEVAKRLHTLAFPGQEQPFIAVNCGALSEALLERHEDILWLADRFLEACNKTHPEASRVWGAAAPDEPGISRKNSWERTRRPGIGALPRILRVYPPDLHRITSATTVASTSASMAINAAV